MKRLLAWAGIAWSLGSGCVWTAWKDTTAQASALIAMGEPRSIRILGFDAAAGACVQCGQLDVADYEDYAAARTRKRFETEDAFVAEGCSGRDCVRWDGGSPCLTPAFLDQTPEASWGVALRLLNYEEGIADGVVNLARDSSPGVVAMEVALFDPEHRWVTTQRVRLSRDEWGALQHTTGLDPPLLPATQDANSETRALPRSLGSGSGTLIRQAVDDGIWLLSWMASSQESGGQLLLYQGGGEANKQAVSLARNGRIEEAIAIWESLDAEDSRVASNLGTAYAALGNEERSIHHFEVAQQQRLNRYSRRLLDAARQRESFRSRTRPLQRCSEDPTKTR